MSNNFLNSLVWRRALKSFGSTGQPIDISPILEAARLAPTSFGLQPFQIHVVTNADLKAKLFPASYNQPQIKQCTHLLVFTARNDPTTTVERYIKLQNLDKNYPDYAQSLRKSLTSMSRKQFQEWSSNQAL